MSTEARTRKYRQSVYARKYRYGISEETYLNLLIEQDNSCAVCKVSFDTARPCVDHDHNCCPGTRSCGQCLRGILCPSCITMASLVETRFKYINSMFTYLTKYILKEV